MTSAPVTTARRRPFALVALIALMLVKSVLIIVLVLGAFTATHFGLLDALRVQDFIESISDVPLALLAALVVSAVLLAAALGLLAYRRWGWLLAMVTTGIFVAFDIGAFLAGQPNYIWMALNIVTVFYLNQREVRESVGAASDAGFDPRVAETSS